jgi:hypothetical protein
MKIPFVYVEFIIFRSDFGESSPLEEMVDIIMGGGGNKKNKM